MYQYIKRLFTHSLIYGIGDVIPKAISFLLIPLYTRYLTTGDYGVISSVFAISSVLGIFCLMGLNGAVTRFFFDYNDFNERRKYLGSISIFLLLSTFIIISLLDIFGRNILNKIIPDIPFNPYLRLSIWTIFFMINTSILLAIYRAQEKSKKYVIFSIVNYITTVGFIIYLVVFLKQGALGYIKGTFFASIFIFIICVLLLFEKISLHFDLSRIINSLRFGLPLVPHLLAWWILNLIDRLMLQHFRGLDEVGIYSIGYTIGMILWFVTEAFNNAWMPFFFSTAKGEKNAKEIFSKVTTYYLMGLLFLGLLIITFSKEIVILMTTPEFYESYKVVPIITLANIATGIYLMSANQIFFVKKTHYMPAISITAAVSNILLNILLIPTYGMIGAAYATMISFAICALITYFVSSKLYRIQYEYKRIFELFLIFGFLILIQQQVSFENVNLNLMVKIFTLLAYPSLLFFGHFFNKNETEKILSCFRFLKNIG
jgi:O-antigen/teichoic acid export membrane protein